MRAIARAIPIAIPIAIACCLMLCLVTSYAYAPPLHRARGLSALAARAAARRQINKRLYGAGQRCSSSALKMAEQETKVAREEVPFEIRGFSLGWVFLGAGLSITAVSFVEYFRTIVLNAEAGGLSSLGFVYGIPITLIGVALKYAELAPVPLETTPEASKLFEDLASENLKQVVQDVTRHRYGDDAHLDTTLRTLGLYNEEYPKLIAIKQFVENGGLGFSMVFQSPKTPFKTWVQPEKLFKYEKFFGPGVFARVDKIDAENRILALTLTSVKPPSPEANATPTQSIEEVAQ